MYFTVLLFYGIVGVLTSQVLDEYHKITCDLDRHSKLEIRLGSSERFISKPIADEYKTLYGFNGSLHLTLPFKIYDKNYFFTKLIFGGSTNNVLFMELDPGSSAIGVPIVSGGSIYANIYGGVGLGKHFIKVFKNNSFLRIPVSLNVIYFPFIEGSSDNEFLPLMGLDYQFDIEANYEDKYNFSIVPEVAAEYHFTLPNCTSWSIGAYYSRGINIAHEGSIAIQRANGEVVSQTFRKPYNTFGFSLGYSIYREKKNLGN